jgi:hypothetical protein
VPPPQETSNKAAIRRFHDATNTGDAELISNTFDELVEPDALIRMPLPVQATGAQALVVESLKAGGTVDLFSQMQQLGLIPASRTSRGPVSARRPSFEALEPLAAGTSGRDRPQTGEQTRSRL